MKILNHLWFYALLFAFILHAACASEVKVSEAAVTDKPGFVVVLCDVSSSISARGVNDEKLYSEMITSLKKNCADLIRTYPAKSIINFYIISENATSFPFATVKLKEVLQTNSRIIRQELSKQEQEISTKLDSAALLHEDNTCILTSLQNAYNSIEKNAKQQTGQDFKNEIIIFSDLLEQCKNSPAGSINMKKGAELLSADEFRRLSNYSSKIDFSRYKIDFKAYMTSRSTLSKDARVLDSTWRIILKNYGYKYDETANVLWNVDPNFVIRHEYKR